jgi:hypothetical protein
MCTSSELGLHAIRKGRLCGCQNINRHARTVEGSVNQCLVWVQPPACGCISGQKQEWKSAPVLEAAINLRALSIDSAAEITDENAAAAKAALRSVQGIGFATTNYFLMLLGRPGVKPDRMIRRFLVDATDQGWTNAQANDLVVAAAAQIGARGVAPHELDHAIWSFESRKAAEGSAERSKPRPNLFERIQLEIPAGRGSQLT